MRFNKFDTVLVILLIIAGVAIYMGFRNHNKNYDALMSEYNHYKMTHSRLNTDVNNMPIKETVKEEHTTSIEYVTKKSKDDADLEINTERPKMVLSYNGKKETLLNTEDKGLEKTKTADNKVVYNQKYSTSIDVTPIVNREVANALLQEEVKKERELHHKERISQMQKILIGVGAYYIGREISKH